MNGELKISSVLIVTGPTGSGKTTFTIDLLKDANNLFDKPPKRYIWHYGEIKPKGLPPFVQVKQGLPEPDEIHRKTFLVLDDLMFESCGNKKVANLFTRVSSHRNCFIVFLTQNVFQQSSTSRTMTLNASYFCLFKNPRDKTLIRHIAYQFSPDNPDFLISSFNDAVSNPYGYLFLDFKQTTPDNMRVRTKIFSYEQGMVYVDIK